MHDLENDVRRLLEERSHDIDLDLRIPAGVIRRSHRRRVLTACAIGLGAAALALVVVAGVRALPFADSKPLPAETPTPLQEEMPSSFVGLKDGELVLANTETGEVLRVLADRSVVGSEDGDLEPPVRPALAPDRSAVYLSTFRFRPGGEDRRLVRVPLEGGEPEDLGRGADPAVSPDGDRLAYRACSESGCGEALVILGLRTGEETRVMSGDADLQVGEAVWLPDGRLVVELIPPMTEGPGGLQVIDPTRPPGALIDAPSMPDPTSNTGPQALYGYDPQAGGVVVAGKGPEDKRVRFVSVDADTGEVLRTVVRGGWWQILPDASGRHLLLLDFRKRVYISHDGGEPQLIARGLSDVAW